MTHPPVSAPSALHMVPSHNCPRACCNHDTLSSNTWFEPPLSSAGRSATQVCMYDCPVRDTCLQDVMTHSPQPPGIWAGLNERERITLHRRMKRRTSTSTNGTPA